MDAFVPEVAPPPLLECRDLTKRYGATVALDRFTVSLPAGRIVGLLGPNGSGKTTLLKMIAGVAHPTAGDIRVAGYEVGPESKALVSYLPERPYFSRSMRWAMAALMYAFTLSPALSAAARITSF